MMLHKLERAWFLGYETTVTEVWSGNAVRLKTPADHNHTKDLGQLCGLTVVRNGFLLPALLWLYCSILIVLCGPVVSNPDVNLLLRLPVSLPQDHPQIIFKCSPPTPQYDEDIYKCTNAAYKPRYSGDHESPISWSVNALHHTLLTYITIYKQIP